jgi:hypothetical protein
MESSRWDLRIAGGKIVDGGRGVMLTVAVALARDLAKRGYRCWLRERTRVATDADLIVVAVIGGELCARGVDAREPRHLFNVQRMLAELEAA